MSGRRSRVARKAARVVKTDLDREFNSGLGALKRDRDAALQAANAAYEKGLDELREKRTDARAAAAKTYEEGRAKLLKRLAPKAAT